MDNNMNMEGQSPAEKTGTGAVISIVIIVLVLAFGAYYFLKQSTLKNKEMNMYSTEQDPALMALSTQGTSTEFSDIQKDMAATDFSSIDAGFSGTAY